MADCETMKVALSAVDIPWFLPFLCFLHLMSFVFSSSVTCLLPNIVL
jgi:hypothetical protein